MDSFIEFVKSTYVPLENVPKPYGTFHLLFVVISLTIIISACWLMRKNSDKTFRIVMFSIGAALILSEIYKQIYYLFAAGGEGYDWYIFPFQLCSVPMYLSLAVGLMRKNKLRDALCEYLACIGLLGGIMAYVEPSGILTPYYFTIIHSCIWHALLIFIGLYVIITKNACNRLKDYKKAMLVLTGVVVTATLLNILFRRKPSFNMCYISPFYKTPLAVFDLFDTVLMNSLGQYLGRIISAGIYVLALFLGGFGVYSAAYFIKKLIADAKEKEKSTLTV